MRERGREDGGYGDGKGTGGEGVCERKDLWRGRGVVAERQRDREDKQRGGRSETVGMGLLYPVALKVVVRSVAPWVWGDLTFFNGIWYNVPVAARKRRHGARANTGAAAGRG